MILLHKSITILLNLIELLIIVRIILSFLNIHGDNIITRFVYELTEPVLGTAKRINCQNWYKYWNARFFTTIGYSIFKN